MLTAKELGQRLIELGDTQVKVRIKYWNSEDFSSGFEEEIEGENFLILSEEADSRGESIVVLEFEE